MDDKVDAIVGFKAGLDIPATVEILNASHDCGYVVDEEKNGRD